jgi:hypothetical protein
VPFTRFDQLGGVAEGEAVEIVGRYERWNPDLAPPGERPVSARVVLADGIGILIGRYRESRRPDEELEQLAGAVVRVAGRFSRGRDYPGPGPMPGLWTGGGPQIVDLARVEMIEPAVSSPAPIVSSPTPVATATPAAPPLPAPPLILAPPARSLAPLRPGRIARRSLGGGRSRMVFAVPIAVALATSAGVFLAMHAHVVVLAIRYQLPVVVVAGWLALVATHWVVVRWQAVRELRWLAALRWPFDAASYLAQLEGERTFSKLRVDVELVAPIPDAARASLLHRRRLVRATVTWPHAHVVSIQCPPVDTDVTLGRSMRPRYDNAAVHRWFRRCARGAVEPLAAACGIRAVVAHIE